MENGIEETKQERFGGLEIVVVLAAWVISAIICAYLLYPAI